MNSIEETVKAFCMSEHCEGKNISCMLDVITDKNIWPGYKNNWHIWKIKKSTDFMNLTLCGYHKMYNDEKISCCNVLLYHTNLHVKYAFEDMTLFSDLGKSWTQYVHHAGLELIVFHL